MIVGYVSRIFSFIIPAVWRIREEQKTVYLTFDDGPTKDFTPWILDLLDRYDVKATFFCVGQNVNACPDIFGQIKERGHQIGNHSMTHLKGFKTPLENYLRDVDKANDVIGSSIFRPPYGKMTLRQFLCLRKKYKIIMWDVLTRDYNKNISPDKCLSIVKRFVRKGSIIVFHDSQKSSKNMLSALPLSIEYLKREGYVFKTIN